MWMLLSLANGAPDYSALAKDPRDRLLSDSSTPRGFRIVALSHLAEACAADGDVGCVERVFRAAIHPKIRSVDPTGKLGEHGLYLSHLAVILGKCAEVEGRCDAALHSRVVEHLARGSVKQGVIASFPGGSSRYPADQAVTLYGIFLYDRTRGTDLLQEALSAYHQRVDMTAEASWWALPASEVTGSQEWSAIPRGCAAATAFGIAAAHVVDDDLVAAQLEGTEKLVRMRGHPAGDSALAVAITAASQRL